MVVCGGRGFVSAHTWALTFRPPLTSSETAERLRSETPALGLDREHETEGRRDTGGIPPGCVCRRGFDVRLARWELRSPANRKPGKLMVASSRDQQGPNLLVYHSDME